MPRDLMTCVVVVLSMFVLSCGSYDSDDSGYGKPSPPAPTGDAAFDRIQPVIAANCSGCHSPGNTRGLPVFSSGAAFKASKASDELKAGDMPPAPKTISASDKGALLNYLGG